MFPLVRYFSLVSAVVVVLAMIAVTVILTKTMTEQLIEERQNANVSLTQVFSSSVWKQFRDHVKTSAKLDGEALRAHPKTLEIMESVQNLMHGLSVVKVKVYALNGNTVFSTEAAQMGDNKTGNPGFLSALNGDPISEYSNRAKFSAFENEIFDVDVVSSYIPIRDREGRIEAVFEIYDNVSATRRKMETRKHFIIAVVGGLFALLYICLLQIVRRAARILRQQHVDLVEAKANLEDTNEQLVDRTQELEATQETLVQKERLATLGELTSTVSHELRNPLAAIRSSIHLAIKKTEGSELGIDNSLRRAERNVVRCDDIISDLLGYASEPVCETEEIIGDDWLRANLAELDTAEVAENVELVKRLSAPNARLIVSPERVRQAIVNIYENAIQALSDLPEGKTRVLTVRTHVEAENYYMAFEDNGPGMKPELIEKAFEPLFSTKSYGCGLGLATAKKIIEKYGGKLHLESKMDVGTKVVLSLPVKQKQTQAA